MLPSKSVDGHRNDRPILESRITPQRLGRREGAKRQMFAVVSEAEFWYPLGVNHLNACRGGCNGLRDLLTGLDLFVGQCR
jgi:hypothetical protein